jgi:hypothetical protein
VYPDMSHATIAERAIPDVLDTFRAVLDGRTTPDTCTATMPGTSGTTPATTG